jgi:methionyl-tRNA synthetase
MNTSHPSSTFSYLSTTIPYVNAAPHVGFALELVQADALARYARLSGQPFRTSTGSDDHSLKNVRAAAARGESVADFVAQNARAFVELAQLLGARFDEFVATSRDARHPASVARLLSACAARGDLYQKRYRGAYCVGCEQFYRPAELIDGACPEHAEPLEAIEEENWFFRLSRYQARLEEGIVSDKIRILPIERKREVLAFVRAGLDDFSVSRSRDRARGFGIEVPGDTSQVVYVWVDALSNYLTAGDFGGLGLECDWQRAERRVHVLGKGVLRFHAVYWPALLASAGLLWPDELRVHGYLTVEGKKIGKSAGNGVDPRELIREVGVDALRYYLLRHISPFKDADFSRQRLITAHDSELADELGNLALRVLTLASRAPELKLDCFTAATEAETRLDEVARPLAGRLRTAFADHELATAVSEVWELVRAANRYVDRTEPWRLAKSGVAADRERLATVLTTAFAALRLLANALAPFVPALAARLAIHVGGDIVPGALADTSLAAHAKAKAPLGAPTPLVKRLAPRSPL